MTPTYRRWRARFRRYRTRLALMTWTCCHTRVSTADDCPVCGRARR